MTIHSIHHTSRPAVAVTGAVSRRHNRPVGPGGSPRLLRLALLAAVAGTLALCVPQSASAATRGFEVCNYSSYTLKLVHAIGFEGDGAGRPPIGSETAPLACRHFEVPYRFTANTTGSASYQGSRAGRTVNFVASMRVDGVGSPLISCQHRSKEIQTPGCEAPLVAGNRIEVVDPPGTVVDVPGKRAQEQAAILDLLCRARLAVCNFTPTREIKVDSPVHQVGMSLTNNSDVEQGTTITTKDKVSESNSLEFKAEAEAKLPVFDALKVSISAKYGHKWVTEHEFKQDVDVTCPGRHKCWITATQPMLRDIGDFTIVVRNTTWHLRDVYFDSPDPDGNGGYAVEARRLSKPLQRTLPERFQSRKQVRDTYSLPRAARRNAVVQARLGVSIGKRDLDPSAPVAEHRIVLTRQNPRNRLVLRVHKVRLVGTAMSWQGRDWRHSRKWVIRGLSPFDRRVVRLRVRLPVRARDRFCISVRAVSPRALDDRERHCHSTAANRERRSMATGVR